jgi:pimeloyl-ACP methyl ester carboxylesterase
VEIQVDGRRVFAVTGGRPLDETLPTVLFLHGNAGDHTVWALLARYFAHHGRNVLAVDLPGHGRSDGPMPDSVRGFADWCVRLLDALRLDQAAFVGHSMGGLIALDAAARYPRRVWALGLLGVAFPMAVNPAYLALAEANDHKAIELLNDWAVSRQSHIGGNRVPGLWLIGNIMRVVERAKPGVMAAGLRVCQSYRDGLAAAASVRCPVLLILGERDMMTPPASAKELAAKFPAADMVVLKGCGHMLMGERPDETLDALKELI